MPNHPNDDWAIETARDLRLDLYEPQGLVLEEPPDTKTIQRQAGWKETKLTGPVESQLVTALQQSLGRAFDLVIADKAGSGKTVTSLRVHHLLSDPKTCGQIFSDHKTRLAIHWTSSRLPNPGNTHPNLMQTLMADPVLIRLYPDQQKRERVLQYASEHRRLVVVMDGYDELTDDATSFNRQRLIETLYNNPGTLNVSWIFTGRMHAIDDAFRFNRLFQVNRFVRFSLCEFNAETQNRYMAKATQHLPNLKGIHWRDSLENPGPGWNELLGLPYTLREIARAFDEAAPNIPKWSSPSDLFCQTSRNMLRRELEKPANQDKLRDHSINDVEEAIEVAERTLGSIALELAIQGIRKEVIASSSTEQPKMIRTLVASAKSRFANSCLGDSYTAPDAERLWEWSYDFVGDFICHNGSTQAYVTATSLGFTTQRILEMWAARYITKYACVQDLRDVSKPDASVLRHNDDTAWTNLWECAIRMPIHSDDKPHGVDVQRYRQAIELLFERPIKADQRRPTELMWIAERWVQQQHPGMEAKLREHLRGQFLEILKGPDGKQKEIARDLIDLKNFVVLADPQDKRDEFDNGKFHRGQQEVRLSRYQMCKYAVSNQQYWLFDNNFAGRSDDDRVGDFNSPLQPAVFVSWYDAYWYCEFVDIGSKDLRVVLPTEARWEYAARSGSTGGYFRNGNGQEVTEEDLADYAHFGQDWDSGRTLPVKGHGKHPNAWGMEMMVGNVWEWCWDWCRDYPKDAVLHDPDGPENGSDRVIRGGGWDGGAADCRSAVRFRDGPSYRAGSDGFRVALSSSGIPESPEASAGVGERSLRS
jgi:formylglycine-generating enzyme required for sulfatase activity